MGIKITRKGYLYLTILILILLLGGFGYAYFSSPTIRGWVAGMSKAKSTPIPTTTPASTTTPSTTTPVTASANDAELRSNLLQEILKNGEWRKQAIVIEVNNGIVTVRGDIISDAEKTALEKFARAYAGVKDVKNELTVKSSDSSTSALPGEDPDAKLAKEVEFTLYKTDAFDLHTLTILATNGQVTLRGMVRSKAEKLLAERIAKDLSGVKSVTSDLTIKDDN